MPQLPDRQRSGFLQTEVPRATGPILEVGQQFDALAKLGGTIGNIALDLQEKRNKADEQQFLTNKDTEDLLATKKFMQDQRLKSIDGSGYTDAVTKFVSDRKAKNLEEAPSESAKMRYEASANNFFARSVIDASSYEREAKIKKMDFDMTNNVQARASAHIDVPNPAGALEDMKAMDRDYDGYVAASVYDPLTGEKLKADAKNQITKSLLDGFYNKGNASLKQGLDLITTKKGEAESEFSNALTPTEKQQYKHKFLQKMESDREVNTSAIINRASNMSARALIKRDVTDSEFKSQINSASRIRDPYKRAEVIDNLEVAQFVSNKLREAEGLPTDKLLGSVATVSQDLKNKVSGGDKFAGFSKQLKMETMYQTAVKDLVDYRNANGVEASVAFDPKLKELAKEANGTAPGAMQRFIEQSKLVQEHMGVRADKIRVTTDAKVAEMAEAINRAASPGDVAARLSHYEKQFGPDFRQAMLEASSDEKKAILPEYLAVTNLSNPSDRESLVKAIREKSDIEIKFDANKRGITVESLKQASSEALAPMVEALGGTPSHFAKGFLQASQLQMKQMVGEGMSLRDAKKEITKKYYENNFDKAESARGSIIVPKAPENRKTFIEAFVNTYTPSFNNTDYFGGDRAKYKEFGVYPTPGFLEAAKKRGRTQDQAETEFYSRVESSSKWVTAPSMDGILFVAEEESGKLVPLRNKDGKQIFRSFSEISANPDKNSMERLRSPLKKMFGL